MEAKYEDVCGTCKQGADWLKGNLLTRTVQISEDQTKAQVRSDTSLSSHLGSPLA